MARSAKPRKRIPAPQRSKYPRYVVKLHEDDFFDEEISSGGITLHLHGKRKTAQCPECFKRSDSVHSCRRRRIQHLPCSGQTLWLVFSVRHWYCRNPAFCRVACSLRQFTPAVFTGVTKFTTSTGINSWR